MSDLIDFVEPTFDGFSCCACSKDIVDEKTIVWKDSGNRTLAFCQDCGK